MSMSLHLRYATMTFQMVMAGLSFGLWQHDAWAGLFVFATLASLGFRPAT